MVYVLPERLLALVRPAFNRPAKDSKSKTLRGLAPGCISSDVKLCQRKPLFPFFREPLFLGPLVFFFLFFLSPAKDPLQDEVKCWTDEC